MFCIFLFPTISHPSNGAVNRIVEISDKELDGIVDGIDDLKEDASFSMEFWFRFFCAFWFSSLFSAAFFGVGPFVFFWLRLLGLLQLFLLPVVLGLFLLGFVSQRLSAVVGVSLLCAVLLVFRLLALVARAEWWGFFFLVIAGLFVLIFFVGVLPTLLFGSRVAFVWPYLLIFVSFSK